MSYFDEEPDAPLHGECAAEITRLTAEIARLQSQFDPGKFAHRPDCCGPDIDTHCLGCAMAEADTMRAEIARLRLLLSSVVAHFGKDGNGPGHAHLIPGVWDEFNNQKIAGKPCEWCATWREILEAVE